MNAAKIPTMAANLEASDERRALTACALSDAHREASFRRMLRLGGGAALIVIGLLFLILGISGAGASPAGGAPAGDSLAVADSTAAPAPVPADSAAVAESAASSAPYVSLLTGLIIGLLCIGGGGGCIYLGLQIGAPAVEAVERGSWRFFVHPIGGSGRGLADPLSCSEHNEQRVSIFTLPDDLPQQPYALPTDADPEIALVGAMGGLRAQLEKIEVREVANAFIADQGLLSEVASLAERAALGEPGGAATPEALGSISTFAAEKEQISSALKTLEGRYIDPVGTVHASLESHLKVLENRAPASDGLPKAPAPAEADWEQALRSGIRSLKAELEPATKKLEKTRDDTVSKARAEEKEAREKATAACDATGTDTRLKKAKEELETAEDAARKSAAKKSAKEAKEAEIERLKAEPNPAEAEPGKSSPLQKIGTLRKELEALGEVDAQAAKDKEAVEQAEQAVEAAKKARKEAEKARDEAIEKAEREAKETVEKAEKTCREAIEKLEEPIAELKQQAASLLAHQREHAAPKPPRPPQGMLERALAWRRDGLAEVHQHAQEAARRLQKVLGETSGKLETAQLSGQSFPFESLDVPVYRIRGNFGSSGGDWERVYVPGEYSGVNDTPSFQPLAHLMQRVRAGLSHDQLQLETLG